MLSANLRLGYVCVQLDKSDIERSLSRNQPIFYNGSSSALSRSEHLTVTPYRYFRGAVGAMVVYDITSRSSFLSLERWIRELRTNADASVLVMMV